MSASLQYVSRQTGVKTLPSLVVSNKMAFQSNANRQLADSACFIVKKFEDVEGRGPYSVKSQLNKLNMGWGASPWDLKRVPKQRKFPPTLQVPRQYKINKNIIINVKNGGFSSSYTIPGQI